MALETFRASVRSAGEGLLCKANVRGFEVSMDEPKELGGGNRAMNPVELLLSALGGCITICAVAFAPACGVKLEDFRVDLEGDLDPDGFTGKRRDVRTGFQHIRFKMNIKSSSPEENVRNLVDMIKSRCPVSDTLRGVRVDGDFTVTR
ncbi:MAG TPA: OsmC family protein [Firmicutes bacterium]|nr:OsmC family protein [Bacillota bacterium]